MGNENRKINRSVDIVIDAFIYLGGVSVSEYYTRPEVFKKARESGLKALNEIFGGDTERLNVPGLSCPPLSYGHLGCLGGEIRYPENSDPNMTRMADSIEECIALIERKTDFSQSALFKFYEVYQKKISEDYPNEKIYFGGLGKEGPITSAVLMRGQDFFAELYEKPEESKKLLRLLTDSITDFEKFLWKINGIEPSANSSVGLADDFAGFLPPYMFDEFVIPYWNRYYESLTVTGRRYLHCEGMSRAHLPFLKQCGIYHFQPSVSPLLTCKMLAEELSVEYDWLLPSFELAEMDDAQIVKWVDDAVTITSGANLIRTQANRFMLETEASRHLLCNKGAEKIRIFLDAFKKYD